MLVFQNDGLIDLRAVTLMGANVKEGPEPIGYFGTGLKYAIATCLRAGCTIDIWRGFERHKIESHDVEMRGRTFQAVHLDGRELSYTTELGRNWELWMALRELYCNAQDEPGAKCFRSAEVTPAEGKTTIAVEGMDAVWEELPNVINMEPIKYAEPQAHMIDARQPGQFVFYRGVRVASNSNFMTPPKFTWDIKAHILLTEDRTMTSPIDLRMALDEVLIGSQDKELLNEIIGAGNDYLESKLSWLALASYPDSAAVEVIGDRIERGFFVPKSARNIYAKIKKLDRYPASPDLNEIEKATLRKAIVFLNEIGYKVKEEIIVTDSIGSSLFGTVDGQKIIISRDCFVEGVKFLAGTILEEHVHIKEGFDDESREMQNWLFDQLMHMGERLIGEPL